MTTNPSQPAPQKATDSQQAGASSSPADKDGIKASTPMPDQKAVPATLPVGGMTPATVAKAAAQSHDVSKLRAGMVVLATEDPDEGWWEAKVMQDKGDDLFALQWVGDVEWPMFLRKRSQIALLPADYA